MQPEPEIDPNYFLYRQTETNSHPKLGSESQYYAPPLPSEAVTNDEGKVEWRTNPKPTGYTHYDPHIFITEAARSERRKENRVIYHLLNSLPRLHALYHRKVDQIKNEIMPEAGTTDQDVDSSPEISSAIKRFVARSIIKELEEKSGERLLKPAPLGTLPDARLSQVSLDGTSILDGSSHVKEYLGPAHWKELRLNEKALHYAPSLEGIVQQNGQFEWKKDHTGKKANIDNPHTFSLQAAVEDRRKENQSILSWLKSAPEKVLREYHDSIAKKKNSFLNSPSGPAITNTTKRHIARKLASKFNPDLLKHPK